VTTSASTEREPRRARHPLLQILIVVVVILVLTVAGASWLRGDPGPSGPLTAAQYERELTRACVVTRPAFDKAVAQPAVPATTAEFVGAYVQLRVYVTSLSDALDDLEPQGALRAPHQAYLAALDRLDQRLGALIDAQDTDAPFDPDAAAAQRKAVLTVMDDAGKAFTALGLDGTGCVVL
jgi:hypothetical protein